MAQIEIPPLCAIFLPHADASAHGITRASSDSCRGGGTSHFPALQAPKPPPPSLKATRTIIYRQKNAWGWGEPRGSRGKSSRQDASP